MPSKFEMISFSGAESSRLSALYFLAFANSAGGIMRLFLARDGDGQEFRVKVFMFYFIFSMPL